MEMDGEVAAAKGAGAPSRQLSCFNQPRAAFVSRETETVTNQIIHCCGGRRRFVGPINQIEGVLAAKPFDGVAGVSVIWRKERLRRVNLPSVDFSRAL